ncbi:hypothetical protein PYW07_005265 [Mythimna separata]|uniref:BEN domain-containing protein n=1 Tax=Mythimna separata TaxID=271217 RepID=A0AAD7YEK3_MYTSE|nr:hypothetical protein PYW07_005265 [Mythimna separata]
MAFTKRSECFNWLVLECRNGGRYVVHKNHLLSPLGKELTLGDTVTVLMDREPTMGTLIARTKKRDTLLASPVKLSDEEIAGPCRRLEEGASPQTLDAEPTRLPVGAPSPIPEAAPTRLAVGAQNPLSEAAPTRLPVCAQNPLSEAAPTRLPVGAQNPLSEAAPTRLPVGAQNPLSEAAPTRLAVGAQNPLSEAAPTRLPVGAQNPLSEAAPTRLPVGAQNPLSEAAPTRLPVGAPSPRRRLDAGSSKLPVAGPSRQFEDWQSEDELEDYSSDSSSWVPSDDNASETSIESDTDTCRVTKNNHNRNTQLSLERYKAMPVRRFCANPPKENDIKKQGTTLTMLRNAIAAVLAIMNLIHEIRNDSVKYNSNNVPRLIRRLNDTMNNNKCLEDAMKESEEDPEQEEFNRSDDNVLISNIFDSRPAANRTVLTTNRFNQTAPASRNVFNSKKLNQTAPANRNQNNLSQEWVPIGTGKTLIHKDKFKKVKWDSYSHATRTLLIAYFSRRVLATHSLTGKKSPAFQHKAAKMCLDPKAVSDIVYEVMKRFTVKENLVRSIVTTKCADEAKMLKQRKEKRKKLKAKNNENLTPATVKAIEDFGTEPAKKEEH